VETDDNEALRVKRLNRNSRVREALAEYDRMCSRARTKLEEVLREQYPESTQVRWATDAMRGPWFNGHVVAWPDDTTAGRVPVMNSITRELTWLTARDILRGGDDE
jgi:hypothetical protein